MSVLTIRRSWFFNYRPAAGERWQHRRANEMRPSQGGRVVFDLIISVYVYSDKAGPIVNQEQ